MALALADHWVWDHWIIHDGERFHMFFLRASKALHDPHRRHWRASMGHAVSPDACSWTLLPDAVVHSDGPAFDDMAIWTGSTVVRPDGGLRVFYTGVARAERGMVQRIGWVDSSDGVAFHRTCTQPLEADGRWYEKWNPAYPWDEPWRDPFVFHHDGCWHMLITARARGVERARAGVVAHAISPDLDTWEVLEPLSRPGTFGQLEVMQSRRVHGRDVLVFSCGDDMRPHRMPGGIWVAEGSSPLGPWDIEQAQRVGPEHLYAGQLFQQADSAWALTAFDEGSDGVFGGTVPDPLPWAQVRPAGLP